MVFLYYALPARRQYISTVHFPQKVLVLTGCSKFGSNTSGAFAMLLSLLDAQDSCFLGHVALMGVIES